MSTNTKMVGVPPEFEADAQLVAECVAAKKPIPPEVRQRVQERATRIRQEVYEKHGRLDIGVAAIRELRGELPDT